MSCLSKKKCFWSVVQLPGSRKVHYEVWFPCMDPFVFYRLLGSPILKQGEDVMSIQYELSK